LRFYSSRQVSLNAFRPLLDFQNEADLQDWLARNVK